jgi:hypothetical protein
MAIEFNNTLRGTSIIRVEGVGAYTFSNNDLRASPNTESITAFEIHRNSANIASLHNTGEARLDEWGYSINANRTWANANVTITTGGTLFMEVSKQATYNVDPYTGETI